MSKHAWLLRALPAAAIFAASLALYVSTLAPGMLRGDSGEFQWAMASLNVAHATGYPLYTLIGHAWLQLPLPGLPAWRLNLLSALFGAGAVTMVMILARTLTRRLDVALAAAVFFAVAPVFWFNASILEVYTLNALFLALILYLLTRWGQTPAAQRKDAPLYLAFFVIGFSLAHHRLTILLAPAIAVYLALVEPRFFRNWRRLLVLALLLLPGVALYLYVPWRLLAAGESLRYAIVDIVLGREFAGSLRLYPQPLYVLVQVPVQNFQVGLILAAAGAVSLFRRSRSIGALLLLTLLVDVAFALFYSVPDVEVFLTPAFVVLALWIAAGLASLIEWLASRLSPVLARQAGGAVALLSLALALTSLAQYPAVKAQVAAEAGGKEERARAIFAAGLPQNAFLELDWETATAVRYLQSVEGTRTDLEARLINVGARDEFFRMLRNVDAGRPVYVERGVKWTRTAAGYRIESGPVDLVRVMPEASQAQLLQVAVTDRVSLVGLNWTPQQLALTWETTRPLERDLATFIHFFDENGKPLGQQDHAACCEAIFAYRAKEWDPGVKIADVFRPAPEGTRYLQIGMYSLNADEIEPYGRTIALQVGAVQQSPTAHPLGARFGPIEAGSYEMAREGGSLKLAIYWQAVSPVELDYKVFVHLLNAAGEIIAQADHDPVGGVFPTSAWQPGELVRDTFTTAAPSAGQKLEFGLYDPATGRRLLSQDGTDAIVVPVQ